MRPQIFASKKAQIFFKGEKEAKRRGRPAYANEKIGA